MNSNKWWWINRKHTRNQFLKNKSQPEVAGTSADLKLGVGSAISAGSRLGMDSNSMGSTFTLSKIGLVRLGWEPWGAVD